MRRVLVLALLGALSGCASKAPQPSAAVSPSAPASSAAVRPAAVDQTWLTLNPRLSPRAFCFETKGVWRAAAGNCEYQSPD
jgi:hypothetical protein